MRLILLGSPKFTLPTLAALKDSEHELIAVVTQPDRPSGRGHSYTAPPLKQAALELGIPVLQPENVSNAESIERLGDLEPDILVVAAYGQILRQRLLDLPKRGSLNVHASLLPRWRGASPIAAAILSGDPTTGVTIMEVVRALDAGPIVAAREETISPFDTTGSLEERLAVAGAGLLSETLTAWAGGALPTRDQDETLVTNAGQLKREEARLDWSLPAEELWRRVRAFNPWPGAFTTLNAVENAAEVKIWQAWALPETEVNAPPGTVLEPQRLPPESGSSDQAPLVQTGRGSLALVRIQQAGRRPTTGLEFWRGHQSLLGSRLGS